MRNFGDLEVWKDARKLVKTVYELMEILPKSENFGLKPQISRCVISIPVNIAEGSAKDSQKDFVRFLQMTMGSVFELETHLIICSDLSYFELDNELLAKIP